MNTLEGRRLATTAAREALRECMDRRELVVMCGAGISLASPANLPSGADIKRMFLNVILAAWQDSGLPACDLRFIGDMIPERLISAFHSVFGVEVYRFMDPFFAIRPNVNHRALAELGMVGALRDIVTLNFDFGIELAWRGRPPVVLSRDEAMGVRYQDSPCRIHKVHGSLFPEHREAPREIKYSGLQFTIERVGTALNDGLVQWLQAVLRGRSLLVTGYSGDDLDVLPALKRVVGLGRVIWNCHPSATMSNDAASAKWLLSLGHRAVLVDALIEDLLPPMLTSHGVDLPGTDPAPKHAYEGSLKHLKNPDAVLLAAGFLINEAGRDDRSEALQLLIDHLDRRRAYDSNARNWSTRARIMAMQLRAGVTHETGRIGDATLWYERAVDVLRAEAPQEEVALEVTVGQAMCRYAYQRASVFKRPNFLKWGLPALWWAGWLVILAIRRHAPAYMIVGQQRNEDVGARKLASYFVGDLLAAWALIGDVIFLPATIARRLYRVALVALEQAVRPEGAWAPSQSFHQMRRDEVWLLANRHTVQRMRASDHPQRDAMRDWDRRLEHYNYISTNVMKGNIGLRMVILINALRMAAEPASTDVARQGPLDLLREASAMYRAHGYPAGVVKARMYHWLLEPPTPGISLLRTRFRRFGELLKMSRRIV